MEGRTEEALDFSESLLRVAPLDAFWRGARVRHFVWAREYQRALEEGERIREMNPDFVQADEVTAYLMLGRFEEAHRAVVAFQKQAGADIERSSGACGFVGSSGGGGTG